MLALLFTAALASARYTTTSAPNRVELTDRVTNTVVAIAPSTGNAGFSMTVKGHEILWWSPPQSGSFLKLRSDYAAKLVAAWKEKA